MARTIFITDAIAPLGRAAAIRLGRAGWNLVLGGSSLSGLHDVCAELPDAATLPKRVEPTDIDNIVPVIAAGEAQFDQIDAVLMNTRARGAGWRTCLNAQITALALTSEAAAPALARSGGHFVIAGPKRGAQSMESAMQTVARNAARTIASALDADWGDLPCRVSLVEPDGLDGPQAMARRIARVLNGAPPRRTVGGAAAVTRRA